MAGPLDLELSLATLRQPAHVVQCSTAQAGGLVTLLSCNVMLHANEPIYWNQTRLGGAALGSILWAACQTGTLSCRTETSTSLLH